MLEIRAVVMLGLFFFKDAATTEFYTLSLHDALPISRRASAAPLSPEQLLTAMAKRSSCAAHHNADRKSTRLNSSHMSISYAVFCLKKKNEILSHAACRHRFQAICPR